MNFFGTGWMVVWFYLLKSQVVILIASNLLILCPWLW